MVDVLAATYHATLLGEVVMVAVAVGLGSEVGRVVLSVVGPVIVASQRLDVRREGLDRTVVSHSLSGCLWSFGGVKTW